MPESIDYLFVYGTLRSETASDAYREFIASRFSLVSRASIPGKLYFITQFPGLLAAENAHDRVLGEVYSFTGGEARLAEIDEYEGCASHSSRPHLFTRRQETVSCQDGSVKTAWVYYYNFPVSEDMLIRSGDFLDPF